MRTLRNCERNRRTYKIKKSEWQEVFQSEKKHDLLEFYVTSFTIEKSKDLHISKN